MTSSRGLTVAFRVEASVHIGMGHLMRCLTLAGELARRGADCHFICRFLGPLADMVRSQGHAVVALRPVAALAPMAGAAVDPLHDAPHAAWLDTTWADDAAQTRQLLHELEPDWLVVDHYALAAPWERTVCSAVRRLVVIDDLADRPHDCDLLIDFNAYDNTTQRYLEWVGPRTRCLLGPEFALLRPEFASARASQGIQRTRHALFIGFGGADEGNLTLRSVRAAVSICRAGTPCDVVVGAAYPYVEALRAELATAPYRTTQLHVATDQIADLMARARMALCGGGVSTWERMCMGLPSLVVATADNQIEALAYLHAQGGIRYLGRDSDVSSEVLQAELARFWRDGDALAAIGQRAAGVVDGLGAARVADAMLGREATASGAGRAQVSGTPTSDSDDDAQPVYLAALGPAHLQRLTVWKNDPAIAHQIAAHPARFSEADVRGWMDRHASDPNQVFLGIFERPHGQVIGVARLMFIDWVSGVAELGIFIGDQEARGHGQGRAAVTQLLARAFDQLHLERVHLRVMVDNPAAIRCYEACRFVREGLLRSHFLSQGARHDMLVMGILRAEFAAATKVG